MPLAQSSFLKIRTAALADQVDILLLKDLSGEDKWFQVVPLIVNQKGAILALPSGALASEVLERGRDAPPEDLVGPSQEFTVGVEGDPDPNNSLTVLVVEFSPQVRQHLEKKPQRSRRNIVGFQEDLGALPSLEELVEATEQWIQTGCLRHDEFITCPEDGGGGGQQGNLLVKLQEMLDARLSPLEAGLRELKSKAQKPELPQGGPLPNGPSPKDALKDLKGKGNTLHRLREVVGGRQPMAEEPGNVTAQLERGRRGVPKVDEEEAELEAEEDVNVDTMLKVAMVKLLKDMSGKKSSKHRKLPGLPRREDDSEDSNEDEELGSTARGGRGIDQVEKLRNAMKNHPQPYIERMEQRMAKAVNMAEIDSTVPGKFGLTVPIGKSRTIGYCLHGLLEIHKNMIEGRAKLARLNVLRLISAIEQFTLDEGWVVASRLTGTSEPPWGQWSVQDVSALRRAYVYSRLAEATWVGSMINELKEEDWLAKKRNNLKAGTKGGGKKDESTAASSSGA